MNPHTTVFGDMGPDTVPLRLIAHSRSGDKGNHANIGVIAFNELGYAFLHQELTVARIASYFAPWGVSRVERFELPKIMAFNFLLYDVLAGGASQSLRIDTQGKLLGTAIMSLELPAPPNVAKMLEQP